jgi:methionyl aminopeptidase
VGKCDQESLDLIENTYRCLETAIGICKPGTMYRQIGNEIGFQAQDKGLSVVKSYCGHGIGKLFHTSPNISHYPKNKTPGIMQVIYFWRLVKIDLLERACVHY